MNVLNPALYRKLQQCFGVVKVSSQGEAMSYDCVRGNKDEPHLQIHHPGEYYRISCPYCSDTRFRLWINHRYGQRDDFGRRLTFLAVCYNESCLTNPENRNELWEMLSEPGLPLDEFRLNKGKIVPEAAREVHLPGPCKRLDELPDGHKARAYVEGRGFDPDSLGKHYQVSYCTESHYFLARQRLLVPVLQYGKLKGWQARHLGELPWKDPEKKKGLPPKYFSCPGMGKSQLIYNWDRMQTWKTGVVVEGTTDVWRFGPMAGCTFGASLSDYQIRMLSSRFKERSLVLLFDPDAVELDSVRERAARLRKRLPGRFAVVRLPEGTDPGSLEQQFLRPYVQEQAARQNVEVIYRRAP